MIAEKGENNQDNYCKLAPLINATPDTIREYLATLKQHVGIIKKTCRMSLAAGFLMNLSCFVANCYYRDQDQFIAVLSKTLE
jgi:hypothetical protein